MHLWLVVPTWEAPTGEEDAYFAGVLNIAVTSNNHTYYRDAICVDLFTGIGIGGTYDTTILRPDEEQPKNGTRVSWLIDNAILPTYGIPGYTGSLLPSQYWVTNAVNGAALQIAVWDIVHDGGDGFSAGSVQYGSVNHPANPAVLAAANYYRTASAGQWSDLAYIYDNVVQNSTTEAQMLAGPLFLDDGPHPNPEPATLAMAGGVLIGLGALARKKKRTSSAN